MRFLFLLFLLNPLVLLAQASLKDSLILDLRNSSLHDTLRLKSGILLISEFYLSKNPDSAIVFADELLPLARKGKHFKHLVKLMNQKAIACMFTGAFEASVAELKDAIQIADSLNDTQLLNSCYGNIAGTYYQMGNYREALVHYDLVLANQIALKQELNMAKTLTNISNIYSDIGLHQLTRKYLWLAYTIRIYQGDKANIAHTAINLGSSYFDSGVLDSAWYFTRIAEQLCRENGNTKLLGLAVNNLGEIQAQHGNFQRAIGYFEKALKLRTDVGDVIGTLSTKILLANSLMEIGKNEEAMPLLVDAFEEASDLGATRLVNMSSNLLYNEYKKLRRFQDAIRMSDAFFDSKSKLNAEELSRIVIQQQLKSDFDQKTFASERERQIESIKASQDIRQEQILRNVFVVAFIVALIIAFIILVQRNRIKLEQNRSQSLLLNILPFETAKELKVYGSAKARLYESATVLFTDFKEFTQWASVMQPQELVAELNHYFVSFDEIVAKHKVEKIKTIGDAYMAVGGVPEPNFAHASDVVSAALEIVEFVRKEKLKRVEQKLPYLEIRLGIHSGPLVAGVVGIHKFQYDVWGDTVNTASRMESSGEIGKVNISETTYELVKDQFKCEYRGEIGAKGKGKVKMYFVV